jgi:energy-converting hydrogenase Eha subunit E
MSVYALNPLSINGTALAAITEVRYDRRLDIVPLGSDGTAHMTYRGIRKSRPLVEFTTLHAKELAALFVGSTDTPMVVLNGTTGLNFVGAKMSATAPGYNSSAVHQSYVAARGQAFLNSMRWQADGNLECGVQAYCISADGSTDPVVESAVAELPTQGLGLGPFVLYSLTLGDTTLTEVASVDLQIDHRAENNIDNVCFSCGLPYPTAVAQAGVNGPIDMTLTIEIPDLGSTVSTTAVSVVFKRVDQGGVIGTESVTLALAACMIQAEERRLTQGSPAMRRYVCRPRYDNSTKPLTITTA